MNSMKRELERFDVRPGYWTCPNKRKYIFEQTRKSAYDVKYIRDISFINDIKIILKTIAIVFLVKANS